MSEQEREQREALDDLTEDLELDKESSEDVRGGAKVHSGVKIEPITQGISDSVTWLD